jgi:hypothetical protein
MGLSDNDSMRSICSFPMVQLVMEDDDFLEVSSARGHNVATNISSCCLNDQAHLLDQPSLRGVQHNSLTKRAINFKPSRGQRYGSS